MRTLVFCSTILFLTSCGAASDGAHERAQNARKTRILDASATWPSTPDYSNRFDALAPLSNSHTTNDARPSFDPIDDYGGLPRTGEFEFIAAYCSACHSLEIVMQQRANRDGWSDMLTWMEEQQGMVPLDEADRELFLNYFVEHFGP